MQTKIQKYFSIVQNYYDSQSKYFDSRIELNKQAKKLIDMSKQIMTFEQEKELKKLEYEELKTKNMLTDKEKEKMNKLDIQLKELRDKIGKQKLEIEKETGEREKINANSRFFKKRMDEILEELNEAKPNPSFRHPLNYLLLK